MHYRPSSAEVKNVFGLQTTLKLMGPILLLLPFSSTQRQYNFRGQGPLHSSLWPLPHRLTSSARIHLLDCQSLACRGPTAADTGHAEDPCWKPTEAARLHRGWRSEWASDRLKRLESETRPWSPETDWLGWSSTGSSRSHIILQPWFICLGLLFFKQEVCGGRQVEEMFLQFGLSRRSKGKEAVRWTKMLVYL